jgi:hypothetical protein
MDPSKPSNGAASLLVFSLREKKRSHPYLFSCVPVSLIPSVIHAIEKKQKIGDNIVREKTPTIYSCTPKYDLPPVKNRNREREVEEHRQILLQSN